MINVTSVATLTERSLGGLPVESVSETMDYLNFLIYGDPGAGKTVLAGSSDMVEAMAPVLFIDVEGGTFSIRERNPGVDVVRVKSWSDMQKVYDALYKGDHDYKTAVLDSLTEIQKFSMYNIMRDLIRDDPDRDPDIPSMREWGKNIEQIRLLVRAFRDLPMNSIFTALAKEDKDPKTGKMKTRPSLSGKLANEVAGFLDIVGYLYTKPVDGNYHRMLLTQPTDQFVAKDRSDNFPQILQDPTMSMVYDIAMGKVEIKEQPEEAEAE